jgi:hypothetical protein
MTITKEVNMPRRDMTGPRGMGSMTGNRNGRCSNSGMGLGRQRGFNRVSSSLLEEKELLEQRLNEINSALNR